jgi:hypothetical protein
MPDVPLFLIPHVIQNGIRMHGEELERVTVKKTFMHVYAVSIRTRSVKRELRPVRCELRARVPEQSGAGS